MTRAPRRSARLRATFATCAVALLVTLSGCGSAAELSPPPGSSVAGPSSGPVTTPSGDPAPTGAAATGPAAAGLSPTDAPGSLVATSAATAFPAFAHIYLIVMENKEYGSIVGSSQAPYLNALIREYGLATNYDAVAHPSEPNYLALFGGSTFGIRDDGVHGISARNLGDQLDAHHRTWHVYAQDLPATCSLVASASGGVDLVGLAGAYARKHEPAISFTDIAHTSRCARITHLSGFSPTAASFELIVPNMTNDMHDGSVAQGDAFLHAFMPRISRSAAFAHSLVLITWDEGTSSLGGGGHVATLVISTSVPAGRRSSLHHTHYSILRTIEDAWGLGCLANSCSSNDLREFFH